MKKLLLVGAVALFGAMNAQTEKGSWVIGGSTTLGFNSLNTTYKYQGQSTDGPKVSTITITPSVGYFVIDKLAIGLDLGFTSITTKEEEVYMNTTYTYKNTISTFSVLPTATYYFKSGSNVLPYLGVGIGYSSSKTKDSSSASSNTSEESIGGFAWKAKGGVTFLLSPSIGLDLGLSYMANYGKLDSNQDVKVNTGTLGVNAGISVFLK